MDHLRDTMRAKCLAAPTNGGLDLAIVAESGEIKTWVSALARKVAYSTSARTARRRRQRCGLDITLSPVPDENRFTYDDVAHAGNLGISPLAVAFGAEAVDEEERQSWRATRMDRSKPGARLQDFARWKQADFGLPSIGRPAGQNTAALADLVSADIRVVARTAHALIYPATASESINPHLAGLLLSAYTPSDLEILVTEDQADVGAIVLAALTPRPKVAENVGRAMKVIIQGRRPGDGKWSLLSRRLTVAYLESIADTVSENSPHSKSPRTPEAEQAAVADYERLAEQATRFAGQPLGPLVCLVTGEMERTLVQADEVVGRQAAQAALEDLAPEPNNPAAPARDVA